MIPIHPLNNWVKAQDTEALVQLMLGPHRIVNARATNDIAKLTKSTFAQYPLTDAHLPDLKKFKDLITQLPKKEDASLKIRRDDSLKFKKNHFPRLNKLVLDAICQVSEFLPFSIFDSNCNSILLSFLESKELENLQTLRIPNQNWCIKKIERQRLFEQIKAMNAEAMKNNLHKFIDAIFEEFTSFEKSNVDLNSSRTQKKIIFLKNLITPVFLRIHWKDQSLFFRLINESITHSSVCADLKESFLNHLCCSLPEELTELSSELKHPQHLKLMLDCLPCLKLLETSLVNPTDRELAMLVQHPHLQKLEHLTLIPEGGDSNITDEGWNLLLNLKSLKFLSIRSSGDNRFRRMFNRQRIGNDNELTMTDAMQEKLTATLEAREGKLEFSPYVYFKRFSPEYFHPWSERKDE